MGYDALVDRLERDGERRRVTTFPDGSVDTYYAAFDDRGDPITDREAFGDRIARGDSTSVPIERDSREPGGQAVQMATQTHALGDETTLYGHLEDPVFADLPFATVSMGEPARIDVFSFEDDDLLFSEPSSDLASWSLADLEAATSGSVDDAREALAGDAVCCGNWASIGGLTPALSTLAEGALEADVFVLDPGPVRTRSREAVSVLLDALGDLDATTDVVYSVNRTELEDTVGAIRDTSNASDAVEGIDEDDALEALEAVRDAAGITAAVLHEADFAAAATRDGTTTVPNLEVADPQRETGAGDRFSAGLAVARARGWEWETALALGNCCATYYVERVETATRGELASFLERNR